MAAAPPRPTFQVPRPDRTSATRVTNQARPAPRLVPPKSEPRVSLHSVDMEVLGGNALGDPLQRNTRPDPLEERDPLDLVMETLRGVRCERAVETASVCLAAAVRGIGCRAAIAHLWDPRERSFVVVYALGPNAGVLLNARHDADDPLLTFAFEKPNPRVVNYEGARAPLARHGVVGGAWSVLVVPVVEDGEALGAMELIDPLDGSCFDDRHIAAARYAAGKQVELLEGAISSIGKILIPVLE
ncbi:MAG TPA: hypothetical protein VGI39_12855 [Polyangiaceae bacterium]